MSGTRIKINISFKILPFGHAIVEIKGQEEEKAQKEIQAPLYIEPKTTNPEYIEIIFGGQNYTVPKTTGGIL